MLAGRPGLDRPDGGAIICACFQVGTNCGSCKSEIRSIIATNLRKAAE